jgi:uncharacterized Zn-binding protein involved in type VI secretion
LVGPLSRPAVGVPRRTVGTLRRAVGVHGHSVAFPGDSVAFPGDSVASPGDSVASPGDSVASPGDSVASPGDSVAFPGDSVAFPGDSVASPGDSVRVLRRTVSREIVGRRCLVGSGQNAAVLFAGDTELPPESQLECQLLDLEGAFVSFASLPCFRIHIDKEIWWHLAAKFGDVLQTDLFEFW